MLQNNSKYPRIYIFILIALAILIFIAMFFSSTIVGVLYFVAMLVMVVILLMNKKYGVNLTNHKIVFFLLDTINLMAVIAIIYYEYSKHSSILNIFLISLVVFSLLLLVIDSLVLTDTFSSSGEILIIDIAQLCSMICIFTYFNRVSEFWFAIVALLLEILEIVIKIVFRVKLKTKPTVVGSIEMQNKEASNLEKIESIIQSNKEQGDIE